VKKNAMLAGSLAKLYVRDVERKQHIKKNFSTVPISCTWSIKFVLYNCPVFSLRTCKICLLMA
jgi:hypothetical protein